MYILEEIKAKLIRICELITGKISSNKNKPNTNKNISNNKREIEIKINKHK